MSALREALRHGLQARRSSAARTSEWNRPCFVGPVGEHYATNVERKNDFRDNMDYRQRYASRLKRKHETDGYELNARADRQNKGQ